MYESWIQNLGIYFKAAMYFKAQNMYERLYVNSVLKLATSLNIWWNISMLETFLFYDLLHKSSSMKAKLRWRSFTKAYIKGETV